MALVSLASAPSEVSKSQHASESARRYWTLRLALINVATPLHDAENQQFLLLCCSQCSANVEVDESRCGVIIHNPG